jgi:hypothetical protein
MQPPNIITQLHAAFRAFDESAGPQGLYAINEYRAGATPHPKHLGDWQFIIRPALERLEYWTPAKMKVTAVAVGRFHGFAGHKMLDIDLLRCSKIKVRRYGDTYRIDPHHDFADRWKELRLAGRIRSLVHPFTDDERILLFIGFDKGPQPFKHEFAELHEKLGTTEQSAICTQTQWADPHGRGFETLCASWYWPGQSHH